ncbi:MAG: DMT family transporter [Marinosulfonomonas sp.]
MNADRPFLGIMLMLGFCMLAPAGDAIGKYLSDKIPLLQIVFARFAVQAIVLMPFVWLSDRSLAMSRRTRRLVMARSLLHIMGVGLMYLSVRYLPLADAVAIAFVMPFIMLLLGKTVLNEEVGIHRLAACGVGFAGTLLVIQPNFVDVGLAALLPVSVAIVFALFMLVTRQVAKDIDPVPLQAISGIYASVLLLPALVLLPQLTPLEGAILPETPLILLMLCLGVIGSVAHLLMTGSLKFAPSATLAPMQYLEIPFATFAGWLVFNELPNGLAAIGIVITISAGLYIVAREQIKARSTPVPPRPGIDAAK